MTNYKLGKLPPRVDPRTFKLSNLLVKKNLPVLPDSYDVDTQFATNFSDNNMYANDQYGDCVIAGRAHMTLRFEAFEQILLIKISDKEVTDEYFKESGGQDSGLVMLDSLNEWRKSGWTAAGKSYNIYAYAQIDKFNHDELKYSVFLLRGAYTGFSVPQSAMDQFNAGQPWTVVSGSRILGGHCVFIKGYNATGPICVTWGRDQQMTWEFWDTYFDEAYGVVDAQDSWMDPATDPLDCALLNSYLNDITHVPQPPPEPTPPPTPSPCKVGNTVARLMNALPYIFTRKGRFYYLNPPSKESPSLLSRIKATAINYPKNFGEMLAGLMTVCTSALLFFHCEWQINLMTDPYVWGKATDVITKMQGILAQGYTSMRYVPFQDGVFFQMNFGNANDVFLALMALGWFLGIIGTFLLMHGIISIVYKQKLNKLKKIMSDNGFDKPLFPDKP